MGAANKERKTNGRMSSTTAAVKTWQQQHLQPNQQPVRFKALSSQQYIVLRDNSIVDKKPWSVK